MNRILLSAIMALLSLSVWAKDANQSSFSKGKQDSAPTSQHIPSITWDKRSLRMDNRPILPVMGEMHYARIPEKDWRREIQKMKAGGVTIMATYVFWIHHEDEVEGQWDWSGNRNLRRFVEICAEEQMPIVLRIGPFCHGEVYQGGLPCWIVKKSIEDKKNYKLRSLAPGFIAATERLYNQIGAQVRGLMWKDGGPIIGIQLENESRGPWPYFTKLLELAKQAGLEAPIYTRTGWPKMNGRAEFGVILPLYGDYADGFWDRKLTEMPGDYPKAFIMKDTRLSAVIATETFGTNQNTQMQKSDLGYPYLTCELGGGMMPSYHRRLNMSGREPLPLCICKLGSGSNLPGYYMYHGGTNPWSPFHTMGETQNSHATNYNDLPVMSYDFQTILGEMGRPNPIAWHETRWIHQFLKDWGEELSQMDVDTLSEHYARRGQFVFRNDYVRILNEKGTACVTPQDMTWRGLTITSDHIQPFAKADDQLYFITVPNVRKPRLIINGKKYTARLDKPLKINGQSLTVLSPERARQAYVIDGEMHYGDGILYKNGTHIMQEQWLTDTDIQISCTQMKKEGAIRTVSMGSQNVAHQPEDSEFEAAATWSVDLSALFAKYNNDELDNLFLEIDYRGDCARLYADDRLVADNFWNGKPMAVRVSDLIDKRIELKILPLRKDAPIYLQREQRAVLDAAPGEYLLGLDEVKIMHRKTTKFASR